MPEIDNILEERGKTHGQYPKQARCSQALKYVLRTGDKFNQLSGEQLESLELICMKMSRIVNGDPNHKDSWDDISGYATLISNELK